MKARRSGGAQIEQHARPLLLSRGTVMTWNKPEFEVVDVTMEITAYVARR
jgi:coenzyme PQQ precursor peptide PqqA